MSWTDPSTIAGRLPESWKAFGFWERSRIEGQLARECGKGHSLYKAKVRALARDTASDDILFETRDGRALIVHLTWSKSRSDDWPSYSEFDTLNKALNHLLDADPFGL